MTSNNKIDFTNPQGVEFPIGITKKYNAFGSSLIWKNRI